MKEEMRTFGYLCPQCGKTVMGTRSVFALEASNAEVECACGRVPHLRPLRHLRGDP